MPCYDSRSADDRAQMKNRLDASTSAACGAFRLLEKAGIKIPRELSEWWEEHKSMDAEREQSGGERHNPP